MIEKGDLKWVIFQDKQGRLKGFSPATSVKKYAYRNPELSENYRPVLDAIEQSRLPEVRGLIEAKEALKETDTKARAISRFSRLDAEDLPVIDGAGKFKGVVNRGKLVTSVLNSIIRASKR